MLAIILFLLILIASPLLLGSWKWRSVGGSVIPFVIAVALIIVALFVAANDLAAMAPTLEGLFEE